MAITAIAIGASFALSLSQIKKYSATATFQVQDESRDLGLVGTGVQPTLTATELANQAAQAVQDVSVASRVKSSLHSSRQPAELAASVTASVDPNANNVRVQAISSTPGDAAQLANAFAGAAVMVANDSQRASYSAAVRQLAGRAPRKSSAGSVVFAQDLGRLRELALIARPARVATLALPPGAPFSPRPVRNGLLAGLIGLMVSLLLVYLWDSIDRRLGSAGDVERHLGYQVIGRVRDEALGQSPTAAERNRAVDPLDWEQFRILSRNLDFLGLNGFPRTIAVTSAIPEEGKTTVACFIAFATAASGKRTLLIECDLRRPVFAQRLGINPSPGLSDFVNGAAAPVDVLQLVTFDDVMVRSGTGVKPAAGSPAGDASSYRRELVCVTAGTPSQHPAEILESTQFRTMLREAQEVYDAVILDTPPILAVVDALDVIESAEAIIFCGRASKLTRDAANAGKQALERLGDRQIGLVVTGIKPGRDYARDYYSYYTP